MGIKTSYEDFLPGLDPLMSQESTIDENLHTIGVAMKGIYLAFINLEGGLEDAKKAYRDNMAKLGENLKDLKNPVSYEDYRAMDGLRSIGVDVSGTPYSVDMNGVDNFLNKIQIGEKFPSMTPDLFKKTYEDILDHFPC